MEQPYLKWLFLDLNSYFASIEQQANPRLRGRPVAVVPADTDYTCAIAASYEAKAYGIKTGTMIKDAKRMCPGLICVPARHDLYVTYHNKIISEVIKHTPINKIWSIDELSSRLPPNKRNPESAARIAQNIKEGIWKNVGEAINCSIGVAPNTLLAKIAGDMQKPNGFTVITQEELPGKLLTLKLTDLPGIGVNMQRRLNNAGIFSVEDFWNTSPKQARRIWGSVQGERFWYWLHGYDFEIADNPESVVIGHSRVLDPDLRKPEKARLMARRLLTKATYRLRRKGYYASVLAFSARTTDDQRWGGEIKLRTPARDPFTFMAHLDTLWDQMMIDLAGADLFGPRNTLSGMKFKKVSVTFTGLKREADLTGDLLDTAFEATAKTLNKREALAAALDHLQEKYQKETVTLGTPPKTLSGYVGTKIAFARVPEEEEFWH